MNTSADSKSLNERVTSLGKLYRKEAYAELVQEAAELFFLTSGLGKARVSFYWSQAIIQLGAKARPYNPLVFARMAYELAQPNDATATTSDIDIFVRYGCHYVDVLRGMGRTHPIEGVFGSLRRYGLSPLSLARYKLAEGRYLFQTSKDHEAARTAFQASLDAQQDNVSVYAQALLYLAFVKAIDYCQTEVTPESWQAIDDLVKRFRALPHDAIRPAYHDVAAMLLLLRDERNQAMLRRIEKALKF